MNVKRLLSTNVVVNNVHGYTSDIDGTKVRYGTTRTSVALVHDLKRSAALRADCAVRRTKHPLVMGGMLSRGGMLRY